MSGLDEREARLFLDKNYGWAITLRPDGTPHSTVVWLDWDGEHVVFNTAKPRAKWEHLVRDGRATVSVMAQGNPYDYVSVTGPAEVSEQGANEHIDRMAQKYTGRERYPWHNEDETRVIVRVKPERVVSVNRG